MYTELKINFLTHLQHLARTSKIYSQKWNHFLLKLRSKPCCLVQPTRKMQASKAWMYRDVSISSFCKSSQCWKKKILTKWTFMHKRHNLPLNFQNFLPKPFSGKELSKISYFPIGVCDDSLTLHLWLGLKKRCLFALFWPTQNFGK